MVKQKSVSESTREMPNHDFTSNTPLGKCDHASSMVIFSKNGKQDKEHNAQDAGWTNLLKQKFAPFQMSSVYTRPQEAMNEEDRQMATEEQSGIVA